MRSAQIITLTIMTLTLILFQGCARSPGNGSSSDIAYSRGMARPETIDTAPAKTENTRAPLQWTQSRKYTANGPYPVHLSALPENVYDPKNKLDRGWGQEGKAKRITKRISPEKAQYLREMAQRMEPSSRVQVAPNVFLNSKAPITGTSFDSLDYSDCCGGGGSTPPDPELAVGPNHIIAVVNVAFEIYDKSGSSLSGPITFSSFFAETAGCTNTAVFDPNVLYDEEADRFILGIDGDGTDYCVAATTGSDPMGTWNRYGFATDFGGAFFDFPHAGVGIDAIFMGSNQFGSGLPNSFEGRVFAMDKEALYSGTPMAVVSKSTGSGGTPQPMNLHGYNNGTWPGSGPHYIMTEVFDGANHTLWSWKDPFGEDVFTRITDLNLNTATGVVAGFPLDVPQNGGEDIQGNDWRGLDTEYQNGNIWITNTIACNPGSGTVNCIRWARIDPQLAVVLDAGVYSSNDEYRIFPDLAVNQCGDMAIGYTKSSASTLPGIWITGRKNSDQASTLQAETEVKGGEIVYTAFDSAPRRWGDYTGMTIDPDGKTFWYLGEYSKLTETSSGRWGTYISSFSFPSCSNTEARDNFILKLIPAIISSSQKKDGQGR